jgi:hypothetical protein
MNEEKFFNIDWSPFMVIGDYFLRKHTTRDEWAPFQARLCGLPKGN